MAKALGEDQALEILETAWQNGVRYFDTAPFGGFGMAEERLGKFLKIKKKMNMLFQQK